MGGGEENLRTARVSAAIRNLPLSKQTQIVPPTKLINNVVLNVMTPCSLVGFEGKYCLLFRAGRTISFRF